MKFCSKRLCHPFFVLIRTRIFCFVQQFFLSSQVSFVNASRIVFPNCPQTFLAAQAPKPLSFNHFWHMVIQEEVSTLSRFFYFPQLSVIVIITKLVEKNKRKAHQYWPEDAGEEPLGLVLEIGGARSFWVM